jgi:hypothetical protein
MAGDTTSQPQEVKRSMGESGGPELFSRIKCKKEPSTIAEDPEIPPGINIRFQVKCMNLYRVTVKDRHGNLSDFERSAIKIQMAAQGYNGTSEIIKIERLDRITGEVLGGIYNE